MITNKYCFQCIYCNRKYKRKTYYNNHITICRLLNNNEQFKNELEEREDTPSKKELYDLILYQNNEIFKLKKKFNEIKIYQKKKICVIDYLNTTYKLEINYEEWLKNLNVSQDGLNNIFELGIIRGIILILKNYSDNIPIVSALDKLYIYSNNLWILMTQENLKYLLQLINKKIFCQFEKWNTEFEKKMSKEKYNDLYILNIKKILCAKYSKNELETRVKRKMCKEFKIYLDNNTFNIN